MAGANQVRSAIIWALARCRLIDSVSQNSAATHAVGHVGVERLLPDHVGEELLRLWPEAAGDLEGDREEVDALAVAPRLTRSFLCSPLRAAAMTFLELASMLDEQNSEEAVTSTASGRAQTPGRGLGK